MAKRRKRTNSIVPAKGRLREMADRLWSLAVRADWSWQCAICGTRKVEAHHLVPRGHEATRYEIRNGIALCANHHKFNKDFSPHMHAAGFIWWLESAHPRLAEWYFDNRQPVFNGTKTAAYYCDHLLTLQQYVEADDFETVCGVRFARYLTEEYATG